MENFENEEWRRVEDYSNYEISSLGRIRSIGGRCSLVQPRVLKTMNGESIAKVSRSLGFDSAVIRIASMGITWSYLNDKFPPSKNVERRKKQ